MFEIFHSQEEGKSEKESNTWELSPIQLEVRFNMGRSLMYRALVKAGFGPDTPDEKVEEFFHNWMGVNGPKFMKLFETMARENEDFFEEWYLRPTSLADEMERRMNTQETYRKAA